MILIGDAGVGKSNFLSRVVRNEFNLEAHTIGVEFGTKAIMIDGDRVVGQFWETAGQERYRAITSAYYRGFKGGFLMYSIDNKQSFINARRWLVEIRENAERDALVMLVGNKSDLSDTRQVTTSEGEALASEEGLMFIETSALIPLNIELAFSTVLQGMPRPFDHASLTLQ